MNWWMSVAEGIATMHELLVLVNSLLGQFRLNIIR